MTQAYRAQILHFIDDPAIAGEAAWQYFEDGLLVVEQGHIKAVGPADVLLQGLRIPVEHFPDHLILPGLIDCHIHYPQTEIIAAYGEQLLPWLNHYTFPTEAKFSDVAYARQVADFFLNELLRNGTTTALVFGTVHAASVDAFFAAAQKRGLRMVAGKVLMDRNAPPHLCDSPETGYTESRALIERWHGVDRLHYAVTPRFAPTSSDEQLRRAGELLREFTDVYMHTHLAENLSEVTWVKKLFPAARHYLDVYHKFDLLGRRSVFAHGVHLCDDECERLARAGCAIAHCPTSNLFLGSGLFDMARLQRFGVRIGVGTDIGAGTSFSLFRTLDEAYKVQQLRGHSLNPFQALYLATLGGARALDFEHKIGNFLPGKEADFIVLDLQATPLLKFRLPYCNSLSELLFVLNTLGDDRLVERTYALGECVHKRDIWEAS
jgi:guanine deaminase